MSWYMRRTVNRLAIEDQYTVEPPQKPYLSWPEIEGTVWESLMVEDLCRVMNGRGLSPLEQVCYAFYLKRVPPCVVAQKLQRSRSTVREVIRRAREKMECRGPRLTAFQTEVSRLSARGLTVEQIVAVLGNTDARHVRTAITQVEKWVRRKSFQPGLLTLLIEEFGEEAARSG